MDLDLKPHEWKSNLGRKRRAKEPIFGPGLPGALAYLVGMFATIGIIQWFLR
jgi:hypothetical protein